MRSQSKLFVAALALGTALAMGTASVAFAQRQPQLHAQPPPGALQMPPTGQPGAQPTLQKVDPHNLPPELQKRLDEMRKKRAAGEAPMGGPPQHAPAARGETHGSEAADHEEHHHGGHHEHDPMARPEMPNWWHGLLFADDARYEKGGFLNELLFRRSEMPPPFAATVINFGLLVFIVYRYGRKPLAEALVKRRQTIMGNIDAATKLRDQAQGRLDEYEEKFGQLDQTLADMRREYAAQAAQEKKHILQEAEERRARMRRDAEFRIEQELKTVRQELVQESVIAAVAAAEELIARKLAGADQDRMAEDYLGGIGASVGGTRNVQLLAGGGSA